MAGVAVEDQLLLAAAMCLVSAWLAWKLHKACDDVECRLATWPTGSRLHAADRSEMVPASRRLGQPSKVPKKTSPPIQPVANSLRSSSQAAASAPAKGSVSAQRQRRGQRADAADDQRRQATHGRD